MVTILLVKILTCTLHPLNVLPHGVDSFSHLLYTLLFNFSFAAGLSLEVALNDRLLLLKLINKELFDDIKLYVLLVSEDFQNKQRGEDLVLANVLK